jgi:hypothetical protein
VPGASRLKEGPVPPGLTEIRPHLGLSHRNGRGIKHTWESPRGTTPGFAICPSLTSDERTICGDGLVGPDTFAKWRPVGPVTFL